MRNLAMLLGKAAYTLNRTAPGNPLATEISRKALDYLRRHDLQGSPLRADNGGPVSAPRTQGGDDAGACDRISLSACDNQS